MLKQQAMTGSQKYNQLALWKRMTLVTAMLFSGGPLAVLAPSQAAYASSHKPNTHHHIKHKRLNIREGSETTKLFIICITGNAGQGGSATQESSGANGGSGGNCFINVAAAL